MKTARVKRPSCSRFSFALFHIEPLQITYIVKNRRAARMRSKPSMQGKIDPRITVPHRFPRTETVMVQPPSGSDTKTSPLNFAPSRQSTGSSSASKILEDPYRDPNDEYYPFGACEQNNGCDAPQYRRADQLAFNHDLAALSRSRFSYANDVAISPRTATRLNTEICDWLQQHHCEPEEITISPSPSADVQAPEFEHMNDSDTAYRQHHMQALFNVPPSPKQTTLSTPSSVPEDFPRTDPGATSSSSRTTLSSPPPGTALTKAAKSSREIGDCTYENHPYHFDGQSYKCRHDNCPSDMNYFTEWGLMK